MASIQIHCSSMAISRLHTQQNGLHCISPVARRSYYTNDLVSVGLAQNLCLNFKTNSIRSALNSDGSHFPLHNRRFMHESQVDMLNEFTEQSTGTNRHPDAVAFRTLAAEITPNTLGVFTTDDELDLDHPTDAFSSIPEAIEDIRPGRMVIVVDDEDRENEGDLIMAASLITAEAMAFIVKNGTGIVCVSMKGEDLKRLELPLMVSQNENDEKLSTAFTV